MSTLSARGLLLSQGYAKSSKAFKRLRWIIAGVAMAGACFAANPARAGFTPVGNPFVGELGQQAILENEYGVSLAKSGVDYLGTGLTFKRVDDALDQIWNLKIVAAKAIARFAGNDQTFGYLDGTSGGTFHSLFTVAGKGIDPGGNAASLSLGDNGAYRLARAGTGGTMSSQDADNIDLRDHMVTYELTHSNNSSAGRTFIVFFEDLAGKHSDYDYQDLGVELKTNATAVPLPPAASIGFATLLGAATINWVRTKRNPAT